ncbi:MAG: AI-2E family transporter [Clostridia bacterium]|jgi:predicted PurR-regulated permease PerM|nr:AI-2E family transporter [Clostridia bacterium]
MKLEFEKKFLNYSMYTVITFTICYLIFLMLSNISGIVGMVMSLIGSIKPLIIGFVIAYLMKPLVNFFEKLLARFKVKKRKGKSIFLSYLTVIMSLFLLLFLVYTVIVGEISSNFSIEEMSKTVTERFMHMSDMFEGLEEKLVHIKVSENIRAQIMEVAKAVNDSIGNFFGGTIEYLGALTSNLMTMLIALTMSVYLLKDEDYFRSLLKVFFEKVLHKKINTNAKGYLEDVNTVLMAFIKGQLVDALIIGTISIIVLTAIGLPYGSAVGFIVGLTNMIPYFGPFIGAVPAVIIGLLSGNPMVGLYALIALIIIQNIDGNIIAPKIIGDSVKLHPLFIILAIVVGGTYFGLLGMFLSVPAMGILRLFFIRTLHKELKTEE